MQITVMITSRNRSEDLRGTLHRLARMTPQASEILVTADGCSDDTARMVQSEFPECLLTINASCLGSIYSRDQMLRRANGELVLSLDDDSYPLADDFFAKLPPLFEAHPEAAVITFPELRDDGGYVPTSKSPDSKGHYVSAYPNGAAAMRRADYLKTAGFPPFFIHAYEEPDYALQTYGQGKAVWFEPSLVIRHHYSQTNRDDLRTHHFNARNELWSVWMRCPGLFLPFVSLFRIWRQFCFASKNGWGWLMKEPHWWWDAITGLGDCMDHRSPIGWQTYYSWMRLAKMPIESQRHLARHFHRLQPNDGGADLNMPTPKNRPNDTTSDFQ